MKSQGCSDDGSQRRGGYGVSGCGDGRGGGEGRQAGREEREEGGLGWAGLGGSGRCLRRLRPGLQVEELT